MRGRRSAWFGFVACAVLAARAAAAQGLQLTVEAPAALRRVEDRVRRIRPESLAGPLSRAGLDLPPRVHLTLIADDDPRARELPAWVVARAFGTDRVVIVPARVSAYPFDSIESVVLHELVHLALTSRAGGHPLPRWFHEGVAVSVESGWGFGNQVRLMLAAGSGPAISGVNRLFESDAQPDTTRAYLLAAALVDDIRRRHGAAVPGAIAGRVGGGAPFEQAFLMETGDTVERATARAWAAYRHFNTWVPILTSPSALWGLIVALAAVAFLYRRRRRELQRRIWDDEEERAEAADEDEPPPHPG